MDRQFLCIRWGTKYGPDYLHRLHRMIARCARNKPLMTAFALLDEIRANPEWVAMRARARSRASREVSANEHATLIDAIEARSADAARSAMRDHLTTRFSALRAELADHPLSDG